MNKKGLLVLMILFWCTFSIHAQCDVDSLLFTKIVQHSSEEHADKNGLITIRYTPEFPASLYDYYNHHDSTMVKQFFDKIDIDAAEHGAMLQRIFAKNTQVKVLFEDDLKRLYGKKFWKKYEKAYPKSFGLVGFSQIGYNSDGTEALLYYEIQSHYLVGGGWLAVFSLKNDTWNLVKTIPVVQM